LKRLLQVICLLAAIPSAIAANDQPKDWWHEKSETDKITDSKSFWMFLMAKNEELKPSNYVHPDNFQRLLVGCQDKRNFFAVVISAPAKQSSSGNTSVTSRFGSYKPVTEDWEIEDGGTMLRALSDPINASVALTTVDEFLFRYTTKEGREVTLEFSVVGAKNHLPNVARACGWDYARAVQELH
jgi:hypothetical protein